MTVSPGELNGADVAHHDQIADAKSNGAAKVRLSDDYYRSRLSIIAKNRTHDGSACFLPSFPAPPYQLQMTRASDARFFPTQRRTNRHRE